MVISDSHITSWINNSNKLTENDYNQLKQAISEYPWCATYRLLEAKALDNSDSYLKTKSLKQAALYAADRELLFELIYNQSVVKVEEVKDKEVGKLTEEILEDTTENGTNENIESEINPIRKDEPESAISKESDEVSIDDQIKYDPLVELQDKKLDIVHPARVKLPFDHVAYDPEKELEKLIVDKNEANDGEGKDFLFWLNNVESDDQKEAPKDKSPDTMQSLLDQFLATKTTRPIKTREFYKAETKAESSEIDNMEVVSETLVELYIKQGYFTKAIQGLEKLSLLNPPKSAYFAARIREIQDLQKEN